MINNLNNHLGRLFYTTLGVGSSQEKVKEEERRQERERQIVKRETQGQWVSR